MRFLFVALMASLAAARYNGTGVCAAGIPPNVPNPMYPGGMTLGTGTAPYELKSETTKYTPGSTTPIDIKVPTGKFRGILLYATKASNDRQLVGTWQPQQGYVLCSGNTAIVHDHASNRTGPVTFKFTPPAADQGEIAFHAWIAEGGSGHYWHLNEPIKLASSASAAANATNNTNTNTTNTTRVIPITTNTTNTTRVIPITNTTATPNRTITPPVIIPTPNRTTTPTSSNTTAILPGSGTGDNVTRIVPVNGSDIHTTNVTTTPSPTAQGPASAPSSNVTSPSTPLPTVRPETSGGVSLGNMAMLGLGLLAAVSALFA